MLSIIILLELAIATETTGLTQGGGVGQQSLHFTASFDQLGIKLFEDGKVIA